VEKIFRYEQATDDEVMVNMRSACSVTKAKNTTLRICNSYFSSKANIVKRKRLNIALKY